MSHFHAISQLKGPWEVSIPCCRPGNGGPGSFNCHGHGAGSPGLQARPVVFPAQCSALCPAVWWRCPQTGRPPCTFRFHWDSCSRGRLVISACSRVCIYPFSRQKCCLLSAQHFSAKCLKGAVCTHHLPLPSSHPPNSLWPAPPPRCPSPTPLNHSCQVTVPCLGQWALAPSQRAHRQAGTCPPSGTTFSFHF